jgi:ADP-ribosylglycohydrolase
MRNVHSDELELKEFLGAEMTKNLSSSALHGVQTVAQKFNKVTMSLVKKSSGDSARESEGSSMGQSDREQERRFRNPSGRTARIRPDIRSDNLVDSNELSAIKKGDAVSRKAPSEPPPPEQDFSWANVTGSYRREQAVNGLLWGVAVGDALGLGRGTVSRTGTLKIYGKGPLNYRVLPSLGIPGADFQRMVMTLQAILRSRSQLEAFRASFAYRLRGYFLTLPFYAGRVTFMACLRLCLGANSDLSGIESADNGPLASALAIATVLQGTGHSVERWTALCTETTHTSPEAVESAVLLARSVYLAVMTEPENFEPVAAMDRLIKITEDEGLNAQLRRLREGLTLGLGVHDMAREMGWGGGIPATAGPTALMAIYSWFENHGSFEKTVERAVLLGGDSETLGAVAGGLAGVHLGKESIPVQWRDHLVTAPNSKRWLNQTARRFVDWPHGAEDLHDAPAMPSRPVAQALRSVLLNLLLGAHTIIRTPWKLFHHLVGR